MEKFEEKRFRCKEMKFFDKNLDFHPSSDIGKKISTIKIQNPSMFFV